MPFRGYMISKLYHVTGALRRLPPTHQLERHAQAGAGLHAHILRPPAPIYQAPPPYGYPPMWGNAPGAPYYAHSPAPVNPHDPRTRPALTPPVVSQTVTPAPSAPVPVSQAAHVAPAPVSPPPLVSGTPAAERRATPSQSPRRPLQPHPLGLTPGPRPRGGRSAPRNKSSS
jgi:hypothetical protein